MFLVLTIFYLGSHFWSLVLPFFFCPIEKFLRIDIIYSSDFHKIFIGASNVNEKKYISTSELNTNEIDKFIFDKNTSTDKGFYLKAQINGDFSSEIFYIEDEREELEGLDFILNKRLLSNKSQE